MATMAALQHTFHKLRQLRKEKLKNSTGLPSFFKNSILMAAFKFTPGKSIPCISCLLCWQEAHVFFFSLVSFFFVNFLYASRLGKIGMYRYVCVNN